MAAKGELYIRQWRAVAGITQEELAVRSGLRRQTIILAERGQSDPREETLEAIAKALRIEPKSLRRDPFKRFKAAMVTR